MKRLVLFVLVLVLCRTLATAQIPRSMSYQGVLTDSIGVPKPDGSYAFTFRLYDASSGGNVVGTQTQTLQVSRGLFHTVLDQLLQGVSMDRPYWLSLQVAAEAELTPRIPLTAVAYSLSSVHADTARFALSAPGQGVVDSARIAGTLPNNAVTNQKIADGAVSASKIATGQVVKSLNGARDNVVLTATGGAGISTRGDSIIINAGSAGGAGWSLSGDAGTTATNFIGTLDAQPFNIRTNNILHTAITTKGQIETYNTGGSVFLGRGTGANEDLQNRHNVFVGEEAGFSNTTGSENVAMGYYALYRGSTGSGNVAVGNNALNLNTDGSYNSALGDQALANNVGGSYNTAVGYYALLQNTAGGSNTAVGFKALGRNAGGNSNTAVGSQALLGNTTGESNTAVGSQALLDNTAGESNAALGYQALANNVGGSYNTALGVLALLDNAAGGSNTAVGFKALGRTVGSSNTAVGTNALLGNTGGSYNTASGVDALVNTTNSQYNTALGYRAGRLYDNGYNNVFLGANVDVDGAGYYNVIAIGQGTVVTGSSTARFGNSATVSYGGWANWSNVSDGRFKKNVNTAVPGLAFITKLRPITYNLDATALDAFLHQNSKSDPTGNAPARAEQVRALQAKESITQTGFVAQEVEAAAKQLGYNFSGVDAPKGPNDYYALRYAEFVVPLVKAVQEQQQMIDAQQKEINELKSIVKSLSPATK